ncbi:porin family protein [bacterium]|nr:porin family protein [bacterium]MCB2201530.1 porin family protein [bacterium]
MRGIFSLLAVVVLASTVAARNPVFGVRAGAGVSGATGEVSETANVGFHGELGVRITPAPVSSSELDLLLVGSFDTFSASKSTVPDLQFMSGGAELRLNIQPQSTSYFYLIGGGGFSYVTRKAFTLEKIATDGSIVFRDVPERTETDPYLTAGAGMVLVSRPGMRLFIELRVVNVFGTIVKNYTFVPLTVGIGL